MAKYSFEFKRMVVMEYVSGQGGYDFLAKSTASRQVLELENG